MDSGADPHHLGGVSARGTSLSWWRAASRCFDPKGATGTGQVCALAHRRNWQRDRNPSPRSACSKVPGWTSTSRRFSREAGGTAGTATGRRAAGGQRFPQCRALLQVPRKALVQKGWLHDLSQLRLIARDSKHPFAVNRQSGGVNRPDTTWRPARHAGLFVADFMFRTTLGWQRFCCVIVNSGASVGGNKTVTAVVSMTSEIHTRGTFSARRMLGWTTRTESCLSLDTNVLLHEPSPSTLQRHDVLIPMTVLEELDNIRIVKGRQP